MGRKPHHYTGIEMGLRPILLHRLRGLWPLNNRCYKLWAQRAHSHCQGKCKREGPKALPIAIEYITKAMGQSPIAIDIAQNKQ